MLIRRAAALALLALVAVPAAPAAAEQTESQKFFRKQLLASANVTREVKQALRHGGFVDRRVRFGDLTGDGRADALVLVNQGATAGRIALYVFSSHGRRGDGGRAAGLRIAYRHQRLYRARAGLRRMGPRRPNGAVVFRSPVYDPGDVLADPAGWRQVELQWSTRRSRFRRVATRTIDNVRARYCSQTGDVCTRTFKNARGAIYLEIGSVSLQGRYTLCVTTPARHTDCRPFTLRRTGDQYLSRVRWAANFPDEGRGRYTVSWRLGRDRLGPPLGFRRT